MDVMMRYIYIDDGIVFGAGGGACFFHMKLGGHRGRMVRDDMQLEMGLAAPLPLGIDPTVPLFRVYFSSHLKFIKGVSYMAWG
jgi:hypothetical protein